MSKKLSQRQLIKIATNVRIELESFIAIEDETMGISKFTWDFPSDLAGLCIVASIMMFQELRHRGRYPHIVQGCGHWFTHCDGFLIDVTASQFCKPNIVVEKLVFKKNFGFVPKFHDPVYHSYWNANFRARSMNKFKHFQLIRKSIERARISNFNNKRGIYA